MNIRRTIEALSRVTVSNGATENEEEVAKKKIAILQERLDRGETISQVELDRKINAAQAEARRKKEEWEKELREKKKVAAAEAVAWFHKAMGVENTVKQMEELNSGIQVHYSASRIFRK